jgi:hypothetical protein
VSSDLALVVYLVIIAIRIIWIGGFTTLVELEQNCISPFSVLTNCSSDLVEFFNRLFTLHRDYKFFLAIDERSFSTSDGLGSSVLS